MGAEKVIRLQARQGLSEDNWGKAVAAVIFTACAVLVAQSVGSVVSLLGSSFPELIKEPLANAGVLSAYVLVQLLSIIILFAFSPMIIGTISFFNAVAKGEKAEFSMIYSWFSDTQRYLKTVLFCLQLAVRYLLWTFVSLLPMAVFLPLLTSDLFDLTPAVHNSILLVFGIYIAAAVLFWITATAKYFLAPYLFIDHPELSVNACISTSVQYMRGNRFKYVRLVLSFLPWFLLCFFVVPALYVAPYFQASCAISAKWIRESL